MFRELLRDLISPSNKRLGVVVSIANGYAIIATQNGQERLLAASLKSGDNVQIKDGIATKINPVQEYEIYYV
jgi:preprotein translocase subunit YajC